jgi:NADP-dependent 3-hydroxy acid dehydrogenase YdfG
VNKAKLPGKVAWITGASSGIGEALAQQLAAAGATVVLSARREDTLRQVQAKCDRASEHVVQPLDLLDPSTFESAVRTVLARCEHIDLLVHCAGISQRALAIDTEIAVDRRIM